MYLIDTDIMVFSLRGSTIGGSQHPCSFNQDNERDAYGVGFNQSARFFAPVPDRPNEETNE
jgi:hypothetical protein